MKTPARSRGEQEVRAQRSTIAREVVLPVQSYIHTASVGGGVLLAAAAVALAWANSPWGGTYFRILETKLTVDLRVLVFEATVQHWINDALMVLFFFVVGLEVKREFTSGDLSQARRAALPAAAAAGGMVLPALIYLALNWGGGGEGLRGWGVPMATDIAFALAVLALLGDRVPSQLRVFLLAFAALDDIGAILVIAVFYAHDLSIAALGVAAALIGLLVVMRRLGVRDHVYYVLAGILLWAAVYQSGVHATIAGVLLGVLTPHRPWFDRATYNQAADELQRLLGEALGRQDGERADALLGQIEELTRNTEAPLDRLERQVHPWSSFVVLPLFALANAGVEVNGEVLSRALTSRVMWGVLAGLLVGKLAGTLGLAWAAVRLGLGELPAGVSWRQMAGVGLLGGIGFTVSLFIAELAFVDEARAADARIGILAASALAGLAGYAFLRLTAGSPERPPG